MNYLWDSQLNLFKPESARAFSYSDGIEVEQRLLDAVTHAADRSTFSSELAKSIVDWPSEYHLSRRRHCLLRPLNIPLGSRVLELGCGCGALTRYLGEIGAQVLAVEGSLMRGRIAAQRSRELPNVRVVVDDLLHFQTDEQFDYVLLIGVLEYAARFSKSDDPFASYLQVVTRSLAAGGKLVVAIENQLGLKYLNGCTEDHVGTRFFGVQDLYTEATARTFGRRELKTLLDSAGLPNTSFYYPFPDYKLPSVVLSEQAVTAPDFNAANVIAHCHARDYNGSPYRGFDEALAAEVVHRNGLLADLSNSFLVVATASNEAMPHTAELAFSWSADRIPELCTQTRFVRNGTRIEVLKQPLTSASAHKIPLPGDITIRHHACGADYVSGRQILAALKKARALSGDDVAMVEALHPWMAYLLLHAHLDHERSQISDLAAQPPRLGDYVIAGKFLDCVPSNLLDTGNELVPIDVEWDSDRDIPLGWVVTRGLIWSLMSGLPRPSQFDLIDVAAEICHGHNLSVCAPDLQGWMDLEAAFQTAVTGKPWKAEDLRHTSGGLQSFSDAVDRLNVLSLAKQTGEAEAAGLREVVAEREAQIKALNLRVVSQDAELARAATAQDLSRPELATIKSGRSWKLTSLLNMNSRRGRRELQRDEKLVKESGLFDRDWYLAHNPDVAISGQDPLTHYLQHGGQEGRDPGPGFDSQWYLDQNTDVGARGMNPLIHYLRFGRKEGRRAKSSAGEKR
jgi:SAM-dependent methyltransferase